ncbi:YicC/YloC family endoribonuclease [Ottowia massiliensis]|uniref:YicC/YloC family endoribonuclease n=1 Tax=Ottowia massiliensis TaxID=2045302 RepID=UPI0018ECFD7F|nr:YicC/YloC family endoribonuclease [Ottowia massiliensis]
MPVYSMTGYASAQHTPGGNAEIATPAACLALELRSVNSRFLDVVLRLPDELRPQEPALRELIAKRLKRGKVELRVSVEAAAGGALPDVPVRTLQRLAAAQQQVRVWLPEAAPLSVADALRLAAGDSAASPALGEALLPLARQALDELVAARQREGARLLALLQERITALRALAAQAAPLVPQLVQAQRQRFLERWQEALGAAPASEAVTQAAQERALAEATAFAIRIDVAEELGRLAAHLDEIEAVLQKGGETGKRLDFLIQELHREANTLGSKSATLELTRISVDMKVLIEQMREQVQNLE